MDGVEADIRHLHPRLDHRLVAVGEEQPQQRWRRIDDDDQVAVAPTQSAAEIDVRLGEGVGISVHINGGVDDALAGRRPIGVAVILVQVGEVGGPVGGRHGVGAHAQPGDVHRVDRECGRRRRRVEGGERLIRAGHEGAHVAGLEGERYRCAQRLAEDVLDLAAERHLVGRAACRQPADRQPIIGRADYHVVDGRFDGDKLVGDFLDVQRIVETYVEGLSRRARLAAAATILFDHAQRCVGLETERLHFGRRQRAFGGRRARPDVDRYCGVGREGFFTAKGDPAVGGVLIGIAVDCFIGGDLLGGCQAQRVGAPTGQRTDRRQHRVAVDALVKGNKEQRLARLRANRRVGLHSRRRRCAEGPRDSLGQHAAGERGYAGGRLNGVLSRHREAVEIVAVILEGERLCAQPFPHAGQVGRHLDRHIRRRQCIERVERNHRLVKGDIDEGCDGNLAFGRVAQYFQRATCHFGRRHIAGRRWEALRDGLAGDHGRQRLRRQLELLNVGRLGFQWRHTPQDGLDCRGVERLADWPLDGRRWLRLGGAFAEEHFQPVNGGWRGCRIDGHRRSLL